MCWGGNNIKRREKNHSSKGKALMPSPEQTTRDTCSPVQNSILDESFLVKSSNFYILWFRGGTLGGKVY